MLDLARKYVKAGGLSVIPIRTDGTKSPATATWTQYQDRLPTDAELVEMFSRRCGIAILGGDASGHLEVLDFDETGLYQDFASEVEQIATGLLDRLPIVATPSGGRHVYYRCDVVEGNQKLAMRWATDEETGKRRAETRIETRGQRGYCLAPGCPDQCHELGLPYTHCGGPSLLTIPTITPEERQILLTVARSFNLVEVESPTEKKLTQSGSANRDGVTPGDDFNRQATWSEILEPHGWALVHSRGGRDCWRRPGKTDSGWSATTGCTSANGTDLLCVFSTSAFPLDGPVPPKQCSTYSKFAAFAALNHGGDYSAAAKALAAEGYGDHPPKTHRSASPLDGAVAQVAETGVVLNAVVVKGEDGGTFPLAMEQILERLDAQTDGWPRRVNDVLFIDDPQHGLATFAKPANLFGWLHTRVGRVEWRSTSNCVARDELFAELQRVAHRYDAIESHPHFPRLASHYYSHPDVIAQETGALRDYLARFCPETQLDADLMLAFIATLFWGGPSGARPAWAITSDHGRGMGKTAFLSMSGRLVGGAFDVSLREDIATIKKRLLTPEALTKRLVLIDNIKTNKLSWAELEALITAPAISGHQMYRGERSRPNTVNYAMTLNGPAMSKDMAQRSIIVKLAKPQHSPTWEEETAAFVEQNHRAIVNDVAAFFERTPANLARCSRWGSWERQILARLPEPEDAQAVIAERQNEINADDSEASDIEDYFAQELGRLGYAIDVDWVHIPNEVAAEWYARATHSNTSVTSMKRTVKQCAAEGTMTRLRENKCRTHGRGLLWAAGVATAIDYDLESRIRMNSGAWENRHWDR